MRPASAVLWPALAVALCACTVLTEQVIAPVVSVRVTPDSADLPIGRSFHMHAFPIDSTGAFHPVSGMAWATSDAGIVAVDDTGGAVGIGAGTATITVASRGIMGTARVRVGTPPIINVATDSLEFLAAVGGESPDSQEIAIVNAGGLSLAELAVDTIDYGSGPRDWLVAHFDTTVAPATLTLSATTDTLTQPGTYLATVSITGEWATNVPYVITVVLQLDPAPAAVRRTAPPSATTIPPPQTSR